MKMRKLLATGVAATLAVTSMATVASAAEVTKSWSMAQTYGTINLKASAGKELGTKYLLTQEQIDAGATLGISANDKLIVSVNTGDADALTGVKLLVTGVKGSRNSTSQTYEYAFTNYSDEAATVQTYNTSGKYWGLDAYSASAPVGGFLPEQFVEITKIEVAVTGTKDVLTAEEYDKWGSSVWGSYNAAALNVVKAFSETSAVTGDINNTLYGMWGFGYDNSKTTKDKFPYIAAKYSYVDGAKVVLRQDVQLLSVSDEYESWTSGGNNGGLGQDGDQTFDKDDTTVGTNPKDFAGLASQVAEFFNQKTNGDITFKFTTVTTSAGTTWNNGGIPSTQTGIKNFLGDASAKDFGLFINYKQTGSLQAITNINADEGSVTFDIDAILAKLGYQTLGTIDNLYFGLAKGLRYDDDHTEGLFVEEVILSYNDDEVTDEDIVDDEDEDEDTDDEDVEIDEDTEDEDEDIDEDTDDEDVEIDEDTDDEDEDVEIDTDTDDEDEDVDAEDVEVIVPEKEDENPGTGVALAVVPAMIAAAAVVVSKKRK